MDAEQRDRLREPFEPSLIGTIPASKKRPATDFVGHGAVTDRLLRVDPDWSWEPVAWDGAEPAFVRDAQGNPVALWGRLTVCGVTRPGVGTVSGAVESGEPEKELIGDFLRNAAMRFGVALDLWIRAKQAEGGRTAPVTFDVGDWFVANGWRDQDQHDAFMAESKERLRNLPPAYNEAGKAKWKSEGRKWPMSVEESHSWELALSDLELKAKDGEVPGAGDGSGDEPSPQPSERPIEDVVGPEASLL